VSNSPSDPAQANAELAALANKLKLQESVQWFPSSAEDKDEAVTHLRILGKYSVQIQHTGQPDVYEFAAELAEIFKEAGWAVLPVGAQASQEAYATRSIVVVGKSDDRLIRQVRDSLISITRQGMGMGNPFYSGLADITIRIGPRKMRSGDYL
jgi:hypothetical protein